MATLDDDARISALELALDLRFTNREIALQALSHPSAVTDGLASGDYERLEFLGDAVISMIVVDAIYRKFPTMSEGDMTKMKIAVVSGSVLAEVAAELGLAELLILGGSERNTANRGLASALENCFEAVVGAVYLDAGLNEAKRIVLKTLAHRIVPEISRMAGHPKSVLQERAQACGLAPVYEITKVEGPPHQAIFSAKVIIDGKILGEGTGRSKKEAQALAAAAALHKFHW